jgi:glycine/serine hydroxymethyltransferase
MGATAQGFADHEMQPVADAMRDAATAAADHAAKVKRTVRAIFSFFSNAAIEIARWVRERCSFRSRRR